MLKIFRLWGIIIDDTSYDGWHVKCYIYCAIAYTIWNWEPIVYSDNSLYAKEVLLSIFRIFIVIFESQEYICSYLVAGSLSSHFPSQCLIGKESLASSSSWFFDAGLLFMACRLSEIPLRSPSSRILALWRNFLGSCWSFSDGWFAYKSTHIECIWDVVIVIIERSCMDFMLY